ncbi:MAG: CehA/McbA family metallohydrolase [Acidobacteria bacterium]|nr:CehA/McbA family metallohydrolase [Acidobacteriota bacterium]
MPRTRTIRLAGLGLLLVVGCDRRPDSESPTARWDVVETLREEAAAERHASDGGGSAWIEGGALGADGPPAAGRPGRWTLTYEAGPLGVAEGGWIFLQVPPFWGWSTPQVLDLERPGFTEVSTEAEGVVLEPATLDHTLLGIEVRGRALREGERVRMVYGAGPAGAVGDRYAETGRFWIGVDGDGDGVRGLVDSLLAIRIEAGPAARLQLTLPSTARPGDTVRLTLAALDAVGNTGTEIDAEIELSGLGAGLEGPTAVRLDPTAGGRATCELSVVGEGIFAVAASGPDGLWGQSNPLVATADGRRILWADLHGHSGLTDGTGSPADYFTYARDVAALDVVALTDHDHWGMEPLALHPHLWQQIVDETARVHKPGRFVTLLGYEWTSWIHGHRHVLYFDDRGEIFDSTDPEFDSPLELWAALEGRSALTFAHHSAGGPIATNWEIPPDPTFEPVTEISSVHGSSEALDSPRLIYSPVPGNFVRDILDRGFQLGLIGSGDGHDGHPGLAHLAGVNGGLAAILSEELTRGGVLEAMKARRVYATNGPRIVLRAALCGRPMGSELEVGADGRCTLQPEGTVNELDVLAVAPELLQSIEIIRSGQISEAIPCEDSRVCRASRSLEALRPGEYVYLRVLQTDGGAAWSSPFFIR